MIKNYSVATSSKQPRFYLIRKISFFVVFLTNPDWKICSDALPNILEMILLQRERTQKL
jgi:hypothetical protein